MKNARDPALGLPGELRSRRPVAAEADLDVARRVDVRRPRRAGTSASRARRSTPKTSLPVSVCVSKWTRPTGPWRAAHGPHVRLGDRVVAAEHDRERAGVDAPRRRAARSPRASGPGRRGRPARRRSRRSGARRTRRRSASRCGPGGQLAARIARGPKRVPGRSETRSSVGAPTIATSTPASSAGSCVYGAPPKVSSPA